MSTPQQKKIFASIHAAFRFLPLSETTPKRIINIYITIIKNPKEKENDIVSTTDRYAEKDVL